MKPVSLASFRDHVAMRHEDRDKGFETEYQVSTCGVCVGVAGSMQCLSSICSRLVRSL